MMGGRVDGRVGLAADNKRERNDPSRKRGLGEKKRRI